MLIADGWTDYELIDMRKAEKLERFGKYTMIRPDPQIIWDSAGGAGMWKKADMHYRRSKSGGGGWEVKKELPERWQIQYGNLKFHVKPTDFKHMGIFPEQAVNWDWIAEKISRSGRTGSDPVRVLNLFAYTGGATLAAASAGASVCHVDAAKGMNQWAKENIALSGLENSKLRFITDDVLKFVGREIRRGSKYDAIIMDPPSYGRGPGGELWKIEDSLYDLVKSCSELLSENPLFFLINSYTTGFSPLVLENILRCLVVPGFAGKLSSGEVGLKSKAGFVLPCGIYGKWER